MSPRRESDEGLKGWLEGKEWWGHRPAVLLAWVVTIALLVLCVFFMMYDGHTSPAFHF